MKVLDCYGNVALCSMASGEEHSKATMVLVAINNYGEDGGGEIFLCPNHPANQARNLHEITSTYDLLFDLVGIRK